MTGKRNAKGAGSFTINPDGSVTHRKSVGYKSNGQRKILTVTAATKSACIREMKKKEEAWNRQRASSQIQTKDTVASLCYRHLEYQIENGDLKPKSVDRRECTIQNQIEKYSLGRMQIQAVTVTDVDSHIRGLMKKGNLSPSSILKTVDVLNAAYNWAVLRRDLDENPVQAIKPELVKKIKKLSAKQADDADVDVLSDEEVSQFIVEALCKNRDGSWKYPAGCYLLLLLHTGMRCGEMIALRWQDVDWENGLLTIEKSASMAKNRNKRTEGESNYVMVQGETKNQKARVIQLTKEAKQILAILYGRDIPHESNDLIAPTETGRMNTASNLEHRMKVIMKNAGLSDIEGGLHIFRKTFATRMYECGVRVEEIAAYIGDLESTTRKYYIAIRKKIVAGGEIKQIVKLPDMVASQNINLKEDNLQGTG